MPIKDYDPKDIKNIDKIGIIMWGLMGDVLIRTPVIEAFKTLFPNAHIVAIVDPIGKEVLKNNKNIKKIIVSNRKKTNKISYHLNKIKTISDIRKEKLDLIVNLYNGGSSPLVVFFSKAKYKLGFCNQKKYKFVYNIINKCSHDRLKQGQSLYRYMISIVEPFSNQHFSLKPKFYTNKKTVLEMEKYLKNHDYKKIYLLNLGAGDLNKTLNTEKYFELVKYIYEKYKYIPAILSNPSQEFLQENFINDFLKNSHIPYIKLKKLSLEEIASLIQITDFIITPDTGIMHIAMAYDNYIYTIFAYTNPIFVNINNEKFIPVYEHFDENTFYLKQNFTNLTLFKNIEILFEKLQNK